MSASDTPLLSDGGAMFDALLPSHVRDEFVQKRTGSDLFFYLLQPGFLIICLVPLYNVARIYLALKGVLANHDEAAFQLAYIASHCAWLVLSGMMPVLYFTHTDPGFNLWKTSFWRKFMPGGFMPRICAVSCAGVIFLHTACIEEHSGVRARDLPKMDGLACMFDMLYLHQRPNVRHWLDAGVACANAANEGFGSVAPFVVNGSYTLDHKLHGGFAMLDKKRWTCGYTCIGWKPMDFPVLIGVLPKISMGALAVQIVAGNLAPWLWSLYRFTFVTEETSVEHIKQVYTRLTPYHSAAGQGTTCQWLSRYRLVAGAVVLSFLYGAVATWLWTGGIHWDTNMRYLPKEVHVGSLAALLTLVFEVRSSWTRAITEDVVQSTSLISLRISLEWFLAYTLATWRLSAYSQTALMNHAMLFAGLTVCGQLYGFSGPIYYTEKLWYKGEDTFIDPESFEKKHFTLFEWLHLNNRKKYIYLKSYAQHVNDTEAKAASKLWSEIDRALDSPEVLDCLVATLFKEFRKQFYSSIFHFRVNDDLDVLEACGVTNPNKLGNKKAGDTVKGHLKDGWLWLSGEPGYICCPEGAVTRESEADHEERLKMMDDFFKIRSALPRADEGLTSDRRAGCCQRAKPSPEQKAYKALDNLRLWNKMEVKYSLSDEHELPSAADVHDRTSGVGNIAKKLVKRSRITVRPNTMGFLRGGGGGEVEVLWVTHDGHWVDRPRICQCDRKGILSASADWRSLGDECT